MMLRVPVNASAARWSSVAALLFCLSCGRIGFDEVETNIIISGVRFVDAPGAPVEVAVFDSALQEVRFRATSTIVDGRFRVEGEVILGASGHLVDVLVDGDLDGRCRVQNDWMYRVPLDQSRDLATADVAGDEPKNSDGCLSFPLDSDVTMDHCVDCRDIQAVCDSWLTPDADIDGDGSTGADDLTAILADWGLGCAEGEIMSDCGMCQ